MSESRCMRPALPDHLPLALVDELRGRAPCRPAKLSAPPAPPSSFNEWSAATQQQQQDQQQQQQQQQQHEPHRQRQHRQRQQQQQQLSFPVAAAAPGGARGAAWSCYSLCPLVGSRWQRLGMAVCPDALLGRVAPGGQAGGQVGLMGAPCCFLTCRGAVLLICTCALRCTQFLPCPTPSACSALHPVPALPCTERLLCAAPSACSALHPAPALRCTQCLLCARYLLCARCLLRAQSMLGLHGMPPLARIA